jgi:hypothetical protein
MVDSRKLLPFFSGLRPKDTKRAGGDWLFDSGIFLQQMYIHIVQNYSQNVNEKIILRIIFVWFCHVQGKRTGKNDLCPVLSLPVIGIR